MEQQTIKCRICGEPYVFYSHSAADQSACPKCHKKARENMSKPYQPSALNRAGWGGLCWRGWW